LDKVINHDDFHEFPVLQHANQTCVPSNIGISIPCSNWFARLCLTFLKKRYPEIALAIKEDTEFADCKLCNGVEEVSLRGNDFLSS
jgi:hypothetical protein